MKSLPSTSSLSDSIDTPCAVIRAKGATCAAPAAASRSYRARMYEQGRQCNRRSLCPLSGCLPACEMKSDAREGAPAAAHDQWLHVTCAVTIRPLHLPATMHAHFTLTSAEGGPLVQSRGTTISSRRFAVQAQFTVWSSQITSVKTVQTSALGRRQPILRRSDDIPQWHCCSKPAHTARGGPHR